MSASLFDVGIDLGTTNCSLAFIERVPGGLPGDAEESPVQSLAIPQVAHPGIVERFGLLPSFLYLPGPGEVAPSALALPWDTQSSESAGQYARRQAALVATRVVHSAKSWLCHADSDRRKPRPCHCSVARELDAQAPQARHGVVQVAALNRAAHCAREIVYTAAP